MKAITVTVLLICGLISYGQVNIYSKFVNERVINKKQFVKTADDKEHITYLGKIRNKADKTLFYILSVYSEVQAAIEIHGHPNVVYLDPNKVMKRQFELGTPDELPFKLKNNKLYFHYIDSKTTKKELYVNNLGERIPKVLCVAPDNCY